MKPRFPSLCATALFVAFILISHPRAEVVLNIEMVNVGNAGNAADTNGYGAVANAFAIGKYEVTIGQYTTFLNSVAATDPYALYNTSMASDLLGAGISRSGSSGSYTYAVIGPSGMTPAGASSPANRPITYVSWWDAARFANWMQNGQGSGDTETGAYTLGGATSGNAPAVNPGATFFIPTEDQWYKAAYYSPLLNSGSGGYYAYATQSDTAPGNTIGSGANQANYQAGGLYAVTQAPNRLTNQNYLTDVGAFSGSASYYGTFDQSGNVFEWNDTSPNAFQSSRVRRGGYYIGAASTIASSYRLGGLTSLEIYSTGFRLASSTAGPAAVPEPGTWAAAALLVGGATFMRWRKRAKAD